MTKIIIHGGDVHLDDFLSACIVLSKDKTVDAVYRRDPTTDELYDKKVWKLDVGKMNNPEVKAFDHHIKNCDDCTLSLLLKYWGVWEKACTTYTWIETVVILDAKGITNASALLNIPKKAFVMLDSFIERTLFDLIEKTSEIKIGDHLFTFMQYIGDSFFKNMDESDLAKNFVDTYAVKKMFKDVPAIKCIAKKPDTISSGSLMRALHRKKQDLFGDGGIMIYPNNRPNGSISVKRADDDARVDFSNLKVEDGILFVHPSGFFMVLKNMSDYEMEQIILEGIRKAK